MRIHAEPCDVEELIGSTLEQFGSRLEGRKVMIELPQDLPLVPLDFVWMALVMLNIIDNATKYSPPDSPIEIHAGVNGEILEISVADRGIGIPPEDFERVFNKFYRVQRPDVVAGTGLGLSISKGIIEAHGGTIWAEDRSDGGTIIKMHLPLKGMADQ